MTFTYDATDLSSDLAKLRSRLGDTDSNDPLLTDEEHDAVLDEYPTLAAAAVEGCRRILAKLARRTDRSAVGLSSSRSQATQHYRDLLKELQGELGGEARATLTGTSDSEGESLEADTDFRAHSFAVGRDDYP